LFDLLHDLFAQCYRALAALVDLLAVRHHDRRFADPGLADFDLLLRADLLDRLRLFQLGLLLQRVF
jgi:hypothetical protein